MPEISPIEVVAAAIVDRLAAPRTLLAARRTEPAALAGGWELPGGKVDPGETLTEALDRELREELGVEIRRGRQLVGPLPAGRWQLGGHYVLSVWLAEVVDGQPAPLEGHDELRWLSRAELDTVSWLPANAHIVSLLASILWDDQPGDN